MATAQKILDLLFKYEQQSDLVNKKVLYQAIENSLSEGGMKFIIFSCLATQKGKEELIIDFFKTLFFDGGMKTTSRKVKKTMQLIQELESAGISSEVFPILSDTEPRRTWGWQIPQDELTIACEIMIEQAEDSKILPENWQPRLWSEIALGYTGNRNFEKALNWARSTGKHQLCIQEQVKCLTGFSSQYHFPFGLKEAAIRQVGAYAFEGVVLQEKFPNAILLQSEYPLSEKDALYGWLRDKKSPLSIIHPFSN